MKHLRTITRALGALAVIVSGLTLGFVGPASACSCVGPFEWLRQEGAPNVVFIGEMIELRELESQGEFGEGAVEMTFQVDTVYRGEIQDHVFVQSHRDNGANCGFNGGNGPTVILASQSADGVLGTDGCSVAGVAGDGSTERELELLVGPGRTPEAVDPGVLETVRDERRSSGSSTPWAMLVGGAVILGLLGVGLTMVVRGEEPA